MVNPFTVLGKEISDIAKGDMHMGKDFKAPEIVDASSVESLEAYKRYSTQKNLRADRVNFIKGIFDKFSGIALGFAATFIGIFLGGKDKAMAYLAPDKANEAIAQSVREDATKMGITDEARISENIEAAQDTFMQERASAETIIEETGNDMDATMLAGGAIAVALGLSFVGLLFKQFITRDQTDKMAYTNDYYRKAQAEETAKYVEPVLDRQVSKHVVCAQDASWEGLMDPEALKAIQAEESHRA